MNIVIFSAIVGGFLGGYFLKKYMKEKRKNA